MATLVVEATSVTSWGTRSTITIDKPSGTVDGDLLVAFITSVAGSPPDSTPPGWTLQFISSILEELYVYTKVASSEGADWTWGLAAAPNCAGAVVRVSGQDTIFYDQENSASASNSATPSFANTITPGTVNSLIFMFISSFDGSPSSGSGYAIVTDNPTWIEIVDDYDGSQRLFTLAYAIRPETSATGNSSAVIGSSPTDHECVMISIVPHPDVTVTPAVINMAASVQDPAITGDAIVSPAVIDLTGTVQDPTVTIEASKVTNTDKSSESSITNTPKS